MYANSAASSGVSPRSSIVCTRLPLAQVAERPLRRAEQTGERGKALLAGDTLRPARASRYAPGAACAASCRAVRPRSTRNASKHERACDEPDDDSPCRPVDELRQELRRRGRSAHVAGLRRNDRAQTRTILRPARRCDLDVVARPSRGDIGDASTCGRAASRSSCRPRRALPSMRRRSTGRRSRERAAGAVPDRSRALDPDRVDRDGRLARRSRRHSSSVAVLDTSLPSVRTMRTRPTSGLARNCSGALHDRVVERCSLGAGEPDVSQRGVRVDGRRRQAAQLDRVRAEGEHRDRVGARLRRDEAPGCGDGVREAARPPSTSSRRLRARPPSHGRDSGR